MSSRYRRGIIGEFRGKFRSLMVCGGPGMERGRSSLDVVVGTLLSAVVGGLAVDRSPLSRSLGHALG